DAVGDALRELMWLRHLEAVAGAVADFEPRPRGRLRVALAALQGHDAIVATPDDQGRRGDAAEQVRQRGVVHVGLPRDAERHLAIQVPVLEPARLRLGPEQTVERALIAESEPH